MANINAHLPSAVAVPFHPPTENLQHDNLIKPVIPKTKLVSSYTKLRGDEENSQFSAKARDILQYEAKEDSDEFADQESHSNKKRFQFFLRRGENVAFEADDGNAILGDIEDFKEVVSVIQKHYKVAVSPFPEPTHVYAI